MKPPPFVRIINDAWVLKDDNSITVEVEKANTLRWDKTFEKVINQLQKRPSGWVLDVGAFIGDSTSWFIKHGYPTMAFEPQRDAFLCLMRNCPEARLFNFPAGNGERVFLEACASGNLGARGTVGSTKLENAGVPTIRIDDLDIDAPVACIKIDVEGWEPNVLEGAAETIGVNKPIVICEINPKALDNSGFVEQEIVQRFPLDRWDQVEIFRYYDENWDLMFIPK